MARKLESKSLLLRSVQALDLMDKNRVERHGTPGELARGDEARTGSKWLDINAAGFRWKSWHLIRGDLLQARGISRGHKSRGRENPSTEPALSKAEVAKGQKVRELGRKEPDSVSSRWLDVAKV